MHIIDLGIVSLIIQAGGFSLLIKLTSKVFRKLKLFEAKQEALIYAIQKESKNGFGEAYEKKLKETLEELSFIK